MNLLHNKYSGDLTKNILLLVSGNFIGFCVNFFMLPIISRIYSPSILGEYDLIISTGKFLMDAIGLGLFIAIMLPAEDITAKRICQIILFSNLVFLFLISVIIFNISPQIQIFSVSFNYYMAVGMLAVYMFTYNMQNLYYSYANREKKYQVLFWNPVILSASNAGISALMGIAGFETRGYMLGTIASYIISIIYMNFFVSPFSVKISIHEMRKVLERYKDIPLIQMPANLIATLSSEMPIQFLGRMFSTEVLGGYTMACKILSIPVNLLSSSINRVIYRTLAEKKNKGEELGTFCFSTIENNVKLAIMPICILVIFGRPIITVLLGKEWEVSAQYISILGILYLLIFCSSCLSGTLVILNKTKVSFLLAVVSITKHVICFGWAGIAGYTAIQTVSLYAVFECAYNIFNLYLCVKYTNYSKRKFWFFIFKYIILSSVMIHVLRIFILRLS